MLLNAPPGIRSASVDEKPRPDFKDAFPPGTRVEITGAPGELHRDDWIGKVGEIVRVSPADEKKWEVKIGDPNPQIVVSALFSFATQASRTYQVSGCNTGAKYQACNGMYKATELPGYSGVQAYSREGHPHLVLLRWQQEHWILLDMGPSRNRYPGNAEAVELFKIPNNENTPPTARPWPGTETVKKLCAPQTLTLLAENLRPADQPDGGHADQTAVTDARGPETLRVGKRVEAQDGNIVVEWKKGTVESIDEARNPKVRFDDGLPLICQQWRSIVRISTLRLPFAISPQIHVFYLS